MSVIFHASDLHFGRANPDVARALLTEIQKLKPTLAVLSGDFTQVGSTDEFEQAQNFLRGLPCPFLAVPGNHDIPAQDLLKRFANPYGMYRRYISDNLAPVYQDESVFIAGMNTARPILPHWNWANGKISRDQIDAVTDIFSRATPTQWKILVCHHPLYAIVDSPLRTFVWRAGRLRTALRQAGVNMIMTGHIHHASVTFDKEDGGNLYHIGAASAFSTRLRTQGNGYNIIRATPDKVDIALMTWQDDRFQETEKHVIYREQHAATQTT